MKKIAKWILVLAMLTRVCGLSWVCGAENTSDTTKPAPEKLKLSIRYISWEIAFASNVKAEGMDPLISHEYSMISYPSGPASELLTYIKDFEYLDDDIENVDCRWEFILVDSAGGEKARFYANTFLNRAIVGQKVVKPSANFVKWIDHRLHDAFDLGETLNSAGQK
jgi:hypothetical protein